MAERLVGTGVIGLSQDLAGIASRSPISTLATRTSLEMCLQRYMSIHIDAASFTSYDSSDVLGYIHRISWGQI